MDEDGPATVTKVGTEAARFANWLPDLITESADKKYRHRLIREDYDQRRLILEDLKAIVQKAHEDARRRLRKLAGISLDPLQSILAVDPAAGYPEVLHIEDLKGSFGEIFAGFFAEHFAPFSEDEWEVPAYLFRFHMAEFQHLETLRQTNVEARKMPGRTGDDCLAFVRDKHGRIIRLLYCEAKCTNDHDKRLIEAAHMKVSEAVPVDIPQIIDVLLDREKYDSGASAWIHALRYLWLQPGEIENNCERFDLISYICGRSPVKGGRISWIPSDKPHENYTGGRRLEAIEVHLNDVKGLVREVYGKKDEEDVRTGS